MTAPDDLPKHELLRKILNMTTAENDNQALIAIRKANAILKEGGWDWDKLLAGKIKIIGDPWKGMAPPPPRPTVAPANGSTPPPQRQAPRPAPKFFDIDGRAHATLADADYANVVIQRRRQAQADARAAAAARAARTPTIGSTKSNNFAGYCYCCGNHQLAGAAWLFKPGGPKFEVVCDSCNKSTRPVPTRRATPNKTSVFDSL